MSSHYIWNNMYFNDEVDMEMAMAMLSDLEAPKKGVTIGEYVAYVREKIPPRRATWAEIVRFKE